MKAVFKWLLIFATTYLLMVGCKVQTIPTRNDSIKVEYRIDSVYLYERDSIYVDRWRSNDTIYLTKEKWSIRYKDVVKEIHDTIRTEQVIVQPQRYIPDFYKGSTIALWVLIAAIVVYIVLRIVKAIYLRR